MKPYHPSATHPKEGDVTTYTEATSLEEAFGKCVIEFPPEEGWRDHIVRVGDYVNGVDHKVPDAYLPAPDDDVLPLN